MYLAANVSAQCGYGCRHPTGIPAGNAGQAKVTTANPVGGH